MENLKVKNFGKIDESEIRIGDLTVLAGPNNTGKSFISKLLYSLLNSINADLKQEGLRRVVNSLKSSVGYLPIPERRFVKSIERKIFEMETIAISSFQDGNRGFTDIISELVAKSMEIKRILKRVEKFIDVQTEDRRTRQTMFALEKLSEALDGVTREFGGEIDEWNYIYKELKHRIEQDLIRNFQIPNIVELKGQSDQDLEVSVDDMLQLAISGKNFQLDIERSALTELSEITNVVYLESPIYWKLFTALRDIHIPRRFPRSISRVNRDTLTGVPQYFYDIAASLTYEYSGEMAYPEVYQSLVGSDVLNGRISISDRGEMAFQEDGRSVPLQMTATGVANIGILAALIERKIIDHGTMLFINESETHLHPGWQIVMAKALFELAKRDVKVVVATHSLDILKWLEVHVMQHPEDERFVALNHFPNPVYGDDDFDVKIARIKQDLSKPFFDLYLESV